MTLLRTASPLKLLSIAAASVATVAALSLSLASHAQTPPAGMHQGAAGMHDGEHHGDMAAHAQKRFDHLEKKLNLQPSQQAAWSTYKSAMLGMVNERAAKMKQHHEQMNKNGAAGTAQLSTPQRMEEHAKHMREASEAMSRAAQNTQAFYQTLTPDQKTIFDLMAHRGMGHRMGGGMQR